MPLRKIVDVHIDLPGEAYIPRRYVPDMRLKIDLYRRLGRVGTAEELSDLAAELTDRFGPPPGPGGTSAIAGRVATFSHSGGRSSRFTSKRASSCLRYRDRTLVEQLARAAEGRLRVVDGRSAYLPMRKDLTDPDSICAVAKSLLRSG